MWFDQTGLPWVNPSPAMRSPTEAMLYPGVCLFEATNADCRVGEHPFEKVGARFIDGRQYAAALVGHRLPGVTFVPFHDAGVSGAQLIVTDRDAFEPVLTGLVMVAEAHRLYSDQFRIEAHGFDQMVGASWVRERLLKGDRPEAIATAWHAQEAAFERMRLPYLLYGP